MDGFDLDIGDHELVSLLGPSGCGKTTTLRCIAGFESPDDGDILFDQSSVKGPGPREAGPRHGFQNYALFPHMTVSGGLAYGLQMRKTGHRKSTDASGNAGIVQLTGLGDRYPNQLSGGQQQRVALARALIIQPRSCCSMNHWPTSMPNCAKGMRFFIRNLQKDIGITTIYVTHDQAESMVMSGPIVVMFKVVYIRLVNQPRFTTFPGKPRKSLISSVCQISLAVQFRGRGKGMTSTSSKPRPDAALDHGREPPLVPRSS
ncbi:MAG: hypothetical protein CM1200mP20_10530 [Pseudomonadota bacterium]|nr:MAG: hypothetical protein CM1200mP20_10530 [Pseudomonadota bacterium]